MNQVNESKSIDLDAVLEYVSANLYDCLHGFGAGGRTEIVLHAGKLLYRLASLAGLTEAEMTTRYDAAREKVIVQREAVEPPPATRRLLDYRVAEPQGGIKIYREPDGTYTVEHADLCRVYSTVSGFKTYQQAKVEAACLLGGKW